MKKTHKCLLLVYFFEIIMKPFTLGFVIFLSASLRYANSWEIQPAIDCWEECFHEGDIADEEAYKTFSELLGPIIQDLHPKFDFRYAYKFDDINMVELETKL